MELPEYLLKQVERGKVVLVLGAGASMGAQHPEQREVPLASALAAMLNREFLGGRFANDSLATVAELSISESDIRRVQEFVRGVFQPFQPAEFHRLLPTFKWHGLATLNYDLIIERAYANSSHQTIAPVVSNFDRLEDLRRSSKDVLLLKLHGCINRIEDPRVPLILTPDQYVTHQKGRSRLFTTLSEWAAECTVVFVGTSLGDPDLRAILLRLTEEDMPRARFFAVVPEPAQEQVRFWETKKITAIDASFREFLEHLDERIVGIARAVPVPSPALPIFDRLTDSTPALTEATRLFLEHDAVYVHSAMSAPVADPARFYRGFAESWGAIKQELDCSRGLTDKVIMRTVIEATDRGPEMFLIRAEAGAGKSVLLKRLAWTTACDFDQVSLFVEGRSLPAPSVFEELAGLLDGRLYVFVDDAADCVDQLRRIYEMAQRRGIPLTLILAERSSEWHYSSASSLDHLVSDEYVVPYLSDTEISDLIERLTKHGALGTLSGISRGQQEDALRKRAGRQLLVALHEATLGKPFEEIVHDEYNALLPAAAQRMYLTVCFLNWLGTPVRAGLVSRIHGITFEAFEKNFFKPLEHVVSAKLGFRGYDYEYSARHRHVAELVCQQVLVDPQLRFERFMHILGALNVSYETDRRAFTQMVKARVLIELFGERDLVRRVYDAAIKIAPEEGNLLLQRAIFEVRADDGDLAAAARFLGEAERMLPGNSNVAHQFAELELRRAVLAPSRVAREGHLQHARKLIVPLLERKSRDAYAIHTAIKIELCRLEYAIKEDLETLAEETAEAVRNAESLLDAGLQQFPEDNYLLDAESRLATLLGDETRAADALVSAASAPGASPYLILRLGKLWLQQGKLAEAERLLTNALEVEPHHKQLNFLFAQIVDARQGDPIRIEAAFRKSFIEGDSNYSAQLFYARQLYINGKVTEALSRFSELRRAPLTRRRQPRSPWLRAGVSARFTGPIESVETNHGWVRRDGDPHSIYLSETSLSSDDWNAIKRGDRVSFSISFNFFGPVAVDVEVNSGA